MLILNISYKNFHWGIHSVWYRERYRDCGILEWNPVPFPIPSRTRIPSRYRFFRDTGWGLRSSKKWLNSSDLMCLSISNWLLIMIRSHGWVLAFSHDDIFPCLRGVAPSSVQGEKATEKEDIFLPLLVSNLWVNKSIPSQVRFAFAVSLSE